MKVHDFEYGPTIIASNEQLHNIFETRCLPIVMPNRPGNYENPRPELGLELKERLTAWRAKHLTTTFPDLEPIDGISGRLWDITKPMFFMNGLLPIDSSILEDSILSIAGDKDESRKDSLEGRLIAIIREITDEGGLSRFVEWSIKTGDIRNKFNQGRPEDKHVSPQWIGKRLKSMSFHNRIVHGYSEIKITAEEYALILKQYGLNQRETSQPTNSLPKITQQHQTTLKAVESGRESASVHRQRSTFTNPEEKAVYLARLHELKGHSDISRDEMEHLAIESVEDFRNSHDLPF